VYSTPNIKNLDNINIADTLEKRLDIPIYINKDVNFLMLRDIKENNIRKAYTITFNILRRILCILSILSKLLETV